VSHAAEDIFELIRLWSTTGLGIYEDAVKRVALNLIAAGVEDQREGA
jgi:hypothetical protein